MDFSFMLFKAAFLQVKSFMEFQRRLRDRKTNTPEGVCKKSYRYWKDQEDGRSCNLYMPRDADTSNLPLIIDIHGGCWIHGDKDVYDAYNYELVMQGNVVSTLTYRTADKVSLKEQVQDIFAYLHFLHDRQKELGISTSSSMLTGDSAGAQLSLLVSAVNKSEKLQKIFEVEPVDIEFSCLTLSHSVCFVDTAATLKNPWLTKNVAIPGLLKMLYGEDYKHSEVYNNSVRPERYIDDQIKLPPVLLVTSQGDTQFQEQTFELADFFDRRKIEYKLYVEPDENAVHIYNILDPLAAAAKKCNRTMVDFFHRHLQHAGKTDVSKVVQGNTVSHQS